MEQQEQEQEEGQHFTLVKRSGVEEGRLRELPIVIVYSPGRPTSTVCFAPAVEAAGIVVCLVLVLRGRERVETSEVRSRIEAICEL